MKENLNLLIMRHGQTIWNSLNIITGQLDSPLTENGKRQVLIAAKKIKKTGIEIIVSSDLGRAIETANIVSIVLEKPILLKLAQFRERNYGFLQGKRKKDLFSTHPHLFNPNNEMIDYNKIIDIEPYNEFVDRVKKGVFYLKEKFDNQLILLVSHGGVIRLMIDYYKINRYSQKSIKQLIIDNAEIYKF